MFVSLFLVFLSFEANKHIPEKKDATPTRPSPRLRPGDDVTMATAVRQRVLVRRPSGETLYVESLYIGF